MEAFLVSTWSVALAEIGDKTQLLALVLAARFRKPLPIVTGILCATLLNHAAAGTLGTWIGTVLPADILRWILGLSFIAMAIWMAIPDRIDEDELRITSNAGIFIATAIAFFFAEMGDKTQIATIALAAHYLAPVSVIAGTTLGMLIANVPAVFIGNRFAAKLPMRLVHGIAAAIFVVLGLLILSGAGESVSSLLEAR
ncbi:MAG: TMEM165/GDT1 family protein [Chromatiales bacterium]|nr:TMEM165/GDT1 family protein [Chromatiales bacterium]